MTGRIAHSLGRKIRRNRRDNGHTIGSLAAEIRVSDNTVGRWERGEVMPSPSNMRALRKLGLIDGRQDRQGGGNGKEAKSLAPEPTDGVMQTPGNPGSEPHGRMQEVQNAGERELLAHFRSFSANRRRTILKILHLVIASRGSGS